VSPELQRLFDEGRAAWPALELEPEAFARLVAAEGVSHGADLFLACACAQGDPRALAAFDERYLSQAGAILGDRVRGPQDLLETLQAVREHLFVGGHGEPPRIATYAGKSSLRRWVRVVVLRVESNLRRQRRDHEEVLPDADAAALRAIDPELVAVVRRFGDAFNRAFREAFDSLAAEERTLFRLHFIDGLDLLKLGAALRVSRATAGRRMLAARERMRETTVRLLQERLSLDQAELLHLLGVVRSKLDVSLGGLLRDKTWS
jgi:RNA polymerase sigma-70 factor (ECF subfamily)